MQVTDNVLVFFKISGNWLVVDLRISGNEYCEQLLVLLLQVS